MTNDVAARDTASAGKLRLYFCAGITKGTTHGDCVLLEYEATNGNRSFGLIDAGHRVKTQDGSSTVVLDFLRSHGVENLEFFLITHQHPDHLGDAISVIERFPINVLYMKQYDEKYSSGVKQSIYENLLKTAITLGVQVVGVDPRLVDLSFDHLISACPSMTDEFKSWLAEHPEASGLCEAFNERNTLFSFGDVQVKLYNWESWNELGDIWDVEADIPHEVVLGENCNSLGLLARLGNTNALLAGDMNNYPDGGCPNLGDEERLAPEIGRVNFFKLNHHGRGTSNSIPFLNTIQPTYAQITSELYGCMGDTHAWLIDHGVDYAFTTSDPLGTVVTLDGTQVHMGFETLGRFIRKEGEAYFLSAEGVGELPVVYSEVYETASTWEELSELVANNASKWMIDAAGKRVTAESLHVTIDSMNGCMATTRIIVGPGQRVTVTADAETVITRSDMLVSDPLFYVEGDLTLKGPVILDGNRAEMGACEASLVENYGGILAVSGAAFINNLKNESSGSEKSGKTCRGGAVLSLAGVTRLDSGTTVKGNSCVLDLRTASASQSANWSCEGGGIASLGGQLDIDGAVVEDNECVVKVCVEADGGGVNKMAIETHALGGGLYHEDGARSCLKNLTLRNNHAIDVSTCDETSSLITHKSNAYGGGLWIAHAYASLEGMVFESNLLEGVGDSSCLGVGLYATSSQVEVGDSLFTKNSGAAVGGGVFVRKTSISLSGCTFSDHSVERAGGCIAVIGKHESHLRVMKSTFTNNAAQSTDGGALWCECPAVIEASAFAGNTAEKRGGAIFANEGISVDGGCSFLGNIAKAGNDISIGRRSESYYRLESPADVELGKYATDIPLDGGPLLSTMICHCRPEAHRAVIELTAASQTGLSSVTVNGSSCRWNRYVVEEAGTYEVVATDLAERSTRQVVEVTPVDLIS